MHMAIHQSRHQETALEIGYLGRQPDEWRDPFVVAHVNDAALANGNGLGDRTAGIRGENLAVPVDVIGDRVGTETEKDHEQNNEETRNEDPDGRKSVHRSGVKIGFSVRNAKTKIS